MYVRPAIYLICENHAKCPNFQLSDNLSSDFPLKLHWKLQQNVNKSTFMKLYGMANLTSPFFSFYKK